MPVKLFTTSGAAEYKGTTYPTIKKAMANKKTGLTPTIANLGLKNARPVELLSQDQLDAWTPRRASRLTEEQRMEKAAKMIGISVAEMKAALGKRGK